jgi:hypothetical protein
MEERKGPVIFRADALRRYAQGQQQAVLPRFIAPRTFALLWVLMALLLAGMVAAWVAQVPIFASGVATVNGPDEQSGRAGEAVSVVAYLPPDSLPRLRTGQRMFVEAGGAGQRIEVRVTEVAPELQSPDAARALFAPGSGDGRKASAPAVLNGPTAVALGRLEGTPQGLSASLYVGSACRVQVEVGSRKVITYLPLVGRLFGE